MKNIFTVSGGIVLALFLFAACSSSMERDAKKVAEYFCQLNELVEAGNWEAIEAMNKDIEAFDEELKNKYDFDDEAFEKEWLDAIAKALERLDCGVTAGDQ